jgi:hypothetical protein
LASGEIAAGVAIEDWTGAHFIVSEIHKVITSKRGAWLGAGSTAGGGVFGIAGSGDPKRMFPHGEAEMKFQPESFEVPHSLRSR